MFSFLPANGLFGNRLYFVSAADAGAPSPSAITAAVAVVIICLLVKIITALLTLCLKSGSVKAF
jgi:hypothetical protein